MTEKHDLTALEKKELGAGEEKTEAGRFYAPGADILESAEAITLYLEMPGVKQENLDIRLERRRLSIQGNIDFDNYRDFKPVYTEYNVGHFSREFTLSSAINADGIKASAENGVLTLVLPKTVETQARKIQVG